ncbi:hypothetical protein ACOMHN_026427 [Nucella lapillus]
MIQPRGVSACCCSRFDTGQLPCLLKLRQRAGLRLSGRANGGRSCRRRGALQGLGEIATDREELGPTSRFLGKKTRGGRKTRGHGARIGGKDLTSVVWEGLYQCGEGRTLPVWEGRTLPVWCGKDLTSVVWEGPYQRGVRRTLPAWEGRTLPMWCGMDLTSVGWKDSHEPLSHSDIRVGVRGGEAGVLYIDFTEAFDTD